jgi:AraC-like DNA-binding protein
MILREFIPDAPLQKYLHRFWIASSVDAIPAEKCVMDGFVKLFIFLNDNLPEYYDTAGNRKEWGDGIGGHQTGGDLLIKMPAGLKLVFCIFKPAGFYRLFGVPIHLLNNDVVPLTVFLGPRAREFKERVLAADGDEARIRVVNDFFISLVRKLPETYTSVVERANPALDWFDIIYDCGYFDQTHFIKEFRHFTGQPPVAFYSKPHPIKAGPGKTSNKGSRLDRRSAGGCRPLSGAVAFLLSSMKTEV